jgi:hypothetical protein
MRVLTKDLFCLSVGDESLMAMLNAIITNVADRKSRMNLRMLGVFSL